MNSINIHSFLNFFKYEKKDHVTSNVLGYDWKSLFAEDWEEWKAAVKNAIGGPSVLIATSVGGHGPVVAMDCALAIGLTLRGASVRFLLCDGQLSACEKNIYTTNIHDLVSFANLGSPKEICEGCFSHGISRFEGLGLPVLKYSDFLEIEELSEIDSIVNSIKETEFSDFVYRDVHLGEDVLASAMRFYVKGNLSKEKKSASVIRRYFSGAIRTVNVMEKIFSQLKVNHVTCHHGIYVPQGVVSAVARKRSVHVVNWSLAYRQNSFIFSHEKTYHNTLMIEPTSNWEGIEWNSSEEKKIRDYLKSREQGGQDWISYNTSPISKEEKIEKELGLDLSKPCVLLLTNVTWDAQIVYPSNAFPKIENWVIDTISYFIKRIDLNLVIRIHPAEVSGTMPSRERMSSIIRAKFPVLPPNIFIVDSDNKISTYALASRCNCALIYGTKTGVELAAQGIPVVVSGEAWIRNKGIAIDIESHDEYWSELEKLPYTRRLSKEKTLRALKYAHHFFFNRMLPVSVIEKDEKNNQYKMNFKGIHSLKSGGDRGLDVICTGVLEKKEFIYES